MEVIEEIFLTLLNMIEKIDKKQLIKKYENSFGVPRSVYYQKTMKEARERKKHKNTRDNELIFKRYFLVYLQEEFGDILDDGEKLEIVHSNIDRKLNVKNIAKHLWGLMSGEIGGRDGKQVDRELMLFILYDYQ